MKPWLIRRSRGFAAVFNRETDKYLFSVEYSQFHQEWFIYNSRLISPRADNFERSGYALAWAKRRNEAIRRGLEELAPGLLVAHATHSNVDAQ